MNFKINTYLNSSSN